MHFRASDVYSYYRPSECALRVALRHRGEVEDAADSPFERLLRSLGLKHERAHLATISGVADLSGLPQEERERRTLDAIRSGEPVVYQPRFRTTVILDGETCDLVGEPDFLVRESSGYVIRDSKLSRRITENDHPEILLQLRIYGLLFERLVGTPPSDLQVHSGTDQIVSIPYEGETAALEFLADLRRMRLAPEDQYEPVGWSKCNGCGFRERCWGLAEATNDVALLPAVRQAFARKLRRRGITSVTQVLPAIDDLTFQDLFYRVFKTKEPKLLDSAVKIGREAEVRTTGRPEWISRPDLPDLGDCVTFDLEGLPPYLDDLEKIYLWGIKDYRGATPRYLPALSGFGSDGDRSGWEQFLSIAADLLAEHPSLRFVHWGEYEAIKLRRYSGRYPDSTGTAVRVLDGLVNLLSVVRGSVVLPVPSYGLKVIEKYVGFARRLPDSGGAWAMARYIEACEASDPIARDEIMGEILDYNEEDLDATWAVMTWMRAAAGCRGRR